MRLLPFRRKRSLQEMPEEEEDCECAICMGALRFPVRLPCSHQFCGECLDELRRLDGKNCPLCRECLPSTAGMKFYSMALSLMNEGGRCEQEVEALCRKAVESDPECIDAYVLLSNVLTSRKQNGEAIDILRAALAINSSQLIFNNLGVALRYAKEVEGTISAYHKGLRVFPTRQQPSYSADLHFNLANSLKLQGKLTKAVKHYRHAIAIDPQHCSAYLNMGNALAKTRKLHESASAFRSILHFEPQHRQARSNLKLVYAIIAEKHTSRKYRCHGNVLHFCTTCSNQ